MLLSPITVVNGIYVWPRLNKKYPAVFEASYMRRLIAVSAAICRPWLIKAQPHARYSNGFGWIGYSRERVVTYKFIFGS